MKCRYCNVASENEFCSEACTMRSMEFQKYVDRYSRLFLILILGPILLMIPGFVFFDYVLVFLAMITFITGATTIVFPFATPETVSMWGLKKSILAVRWGGLVLLLMGTVFIAMFIVW